MAIPACVQDDQFCQRIPQQIDATPIADGHNPEAFKCGAERMPRVSQFSMRQQNDIPKLVQDQQQILDALWPLLKSGGMLLYATCSVLAEENTLQIQQFLQENADAELQPINSDWGQQQIAGTQIFPGEDGMDGFFYALIQKR